MKAILGFDRLLMPRVLVFLLAGYGADTDRRCLLHI